jgi:mRNA-degrading endonuclease toxin of MazEF toxin-antitoxin module
VAYRQWQILIARLDPVEGSEQGGRRRVLVVSNDQWNQAGINLTVIPISATGRSVFSTGEVEFPATVTGKRCIAMPHQIRTISYKRIEADPNETLKDQTLREKVFEVLLDHLAVESILGP